MDDRIRQLEGEVSARGLRVGIVAARFNDFIVDRLVDAAVGTLLEHGAEPADLVTVWVPGAFEIPVTVRKMVATRRYDAFVALGFGVLTCDTLEQAIERAGSKAGNKGTDAALTAIRMASVLRQIEA